MKQAVFIGVIVGIFIAVILGGVKLFKDIEANGIRVSEVFIQTCQSVGGKAVWNFKYWECLR